MSIQKFSILKTQRLLQPKQRKKRKKKNKILASQIKVSMKKENEFSVFLLYENPKKHAVGSATNS